MNKILGMFAAILTALTLLIVSPTPALAVESRTYYNSCTIFNSDLGTSHTFTFKAYVTYYTADNTAVVTSVESRATGPVASYDMPNWSMYGEHYKSVAGTVLWNFNNDYVYNSNPEVRGQPTSGWHSTVPDSHAFSITFKARFSRIPDKTCPVYLSFG
jgi:hypothetical protein